MSHVLRPSSEKTFHIADALAGVPRCLLLLETALDALAADFQSEPKRGAARELVRLLSAGCPECGFHASSDVLKKIQSLLQVPPDAVSDLQKRITDRLGELLGQLKAQAAGGNQ